MTPGDTLKDPTAAKAWAELPVEERKKVADQLTFQHAKSVKAGEVTLPITNLKGEEVEEEGSIEADGKRHLTEYGRMGIRQMGLYLHQMAEAENGGIQFLSDGRPVLSLDPSQLPRLNKRDEFALVDQMQSDRNSVADGGEVTFEEWVDEVNKGISDPSAKYDKDNAELRERFEGRKAVEKFDIEAAFSDGATVKTVNGNLLVNPDKYDRPSEVEAAIMGSDAPHYEKIVTLEQYRHDADLAASQALQEEVKVDDAMSLTRKATLGAAGAVVDAVAGPKSLQERYEEHLKSGGNSYDFLKANEKEFQAGGFKRHAMKIAYATVKSTLQGGLGTNALLGKGLSSVGIDAGDRFTETMLEVSAELESRTDALDSRYKGWNTKWISERDATELIGQIGSFVAMGGVGKVGSAGLGSIGLKATQQGAARMGLREGMKQFGKGGMTTLLKQRTGEALMTGVVAGLQSGGMSMGGKMNQLLAEGKTFEEAQKEAFLSGAANGIGTMLATSVFGFIAPGAEKPLLGAIAGDSVLDGLAGLAGTLAGRQSIKNAAKAIIADDTVRGVLARGLMKEYGKIGRAAGTNAWKVVAPMASEGLEETFDNVLGEVLEVVFLGGGVGEGIEQAWGNMEEHLKAGLLGVLGGGLGSLMGASPASSYKSVKNSYQQFADGLQRVGETNREVLVTGDAPAADGPPSLEVREFREVVSDPAVLTDPVARDRAVAAIVAKGNEVAERVSGKTGNTSGGAQSPAQQPPAPLPHGKTPPSQGNSTEGAPAPSAGTRTAQSAYQFPEARVEATREDGTTITSSSGVVQTIPVLQETAKGSVDGVKNTIRFKGEDFPGGWTKSQQILTKLFGNSQEWETATPVKIVSGKKSELFNKTVKGAHYRVRMIEADGHPIGVLAEVGNKHAFYTLEEFQAQAEIDKGKASPVFPAEVYKGASPALNLRQPGLEVFRPHDRPASKTAGVDESSSEGEVPGTSGDQESSGGSDSMAPAVRANESEGREETGRADEGTSVETGEIPMESAPVAPETTEETEEPKSAEPAEESQEQEQEQAPEQEPEQLKSEGEVKPVESPPLPAVDPVKEQQRVERETEDRAEPFVYVDENTEGLEAGRNEFKIPVETGEGVLPAGVGSVMMVRSASGKVDQDHMLMVDRVGIEVGEDGISRTYAYGKKIAVSERDAPMRKAQRSALEKLVPMVKRFFTATEFNKPEVEEFAKAAYELMAPGLKLRTVGDNPEIEVTDVVGGLKAFNTVVENGKVKVVISRPHLNAQLQGEMRGLDQKGLAEETKDIVALEVARWMARQLDEEFRHVAALRGIRKEERVAFAQQAAQHPRLKGLVRNILLARGESQLEGNEDMVGIELLAVLGQAAYTGSTSSSEHVAVQSVIRAAANQEAPVGKWAAMMQTLRNYLSRLHRAMQMRKMLRSLPEELRGQVERMEALYNQMTNGGHDFDRISKRLEEEANQRTERARALLYGTNESIIDDTFFAYTQSAVALRELTRDIGVPLRFALHLDPEEETVSISAGLKQYLRDSGASEMISEIEVYLNALNEKGAVRALSNLIVESREKMITARDGLLFDPSKLFERTEEMNPEAQRNQFLRALFELVERPTDPNPAAAEANRARLQQVEDGFERDLRNTEEELNSQQSRAVAAIGQRYQVLLQPMDNLSSEVRQARIQERVRLEAALAENATFNPQGLDPEEISSEEYAAMIVPTKEPTVVGQLEKGDPLGAAEVDDLNLEQMSVIMAANAARMEYAGAQEYRELESRLFEERRKLQDFRDTRDLFFKEISGSRPSKEYQQLIDEHYAAASVETADTRLQRYQKFKESLDDYNSLLRFWPQTLLNIQPNTKWGFGQEEQWLGATVEDDQGNPVPKDPTMFGYSYYTAEQDQHASRGMADGQSETPGPKAYGRRHRYVPEDARPEERSRIERRARAINSNAAALGRAEFESRKEKALLLVSELSDQREFFTTGGFQAMRREGSEEIESPLEWLQKFDEIIELQRFNRSRPGDDALKLLEESMPMLAQVEAWVASLDPKDMDVPARLELDGEPTLAGKWSKLLARRRGLGVVLGDQIPSDGILNLIKAARMIRGDVKAAAGTTEKKHHARKATEEVLPRLVQAVNALNSEVDLMRSTLKEFTAPDAYSSMMRDVRRRQKLGAEEQLAAMGYDPTAQKDPFDELPFDVATLQNLRWAHDFVHSKIGKYMSLKSVYALDLLKDMKRLKWSKDGSMPVQRERTEEELLSGVPSQVSTIGDVREEGGFPREMETGQEGHNLSTSSAGDLSAAEDLESMNHRVRIWTAKAAFFLFDGDMEAVGSFFRTPLGSEDKRFDSEKTRVREWEFNKQKSTKREEGKVAFMKKLKEKGDFLKVNLTELFDSGSTHESFLAEVVEAVAAKEQRVLDEMRTNARDAATTVRRRLEDLPSATEEESFVGRAMAAESDPMVYWADSFTRTGKEAVFDLLGGDPVMSAIIQKVPNLLIYVPNMKTNPLAEDIGGGISIVNAGDTSVLMVPDNMTGSREAILTAVLKHAMDQRPEVRAEITAVSENILARIQRAKELLVLDADDLAKRLEPAFQKLPAKDYAALGENLKTELAIQHREQMKKLFGVFEDKWRTWKFNPRSVGATLSEVMTAENVSESLAHQVHAEFIANVLTDPSVADVLEMTEAEEVDQLSPLFDPATALEVMQRLGSSLQEGRMDVAYESEIERGQQAVARGEAEVEGSEDSSFGMLDSLFDSVPNLESLKLQEEQLVIDELGRGGLQVGSLVKFLRSRRAEEIWKKEEIYEGALVPTAKQLEAMKEAAGGSPSHIFMTNSILRLMSSMDGSVIAGTQVARADMAEAFEQTRRGGRLSDEAILKKSLSVSPLFMDPNGGMAKASWMEFGGDYSPLTAVFRVARHRRIRDQLLGSGEFLSQMVDRFTEAPGWHLEGKQDRVAYLAAPEVLAPNGSVWSNPIDEIRKYIPEEVIEEVRREVEAERQGIMDSQSKAEDEIKRLEKMLSKLEKAELEVVPDATMEAAEIRRAVGRSLIWAIREAEAGALNAATRLSVVVKMAFQTDGFPEFDNVEQIGRDYEGALQSLNRVDRQLLDLKVDEQTQIIDEGRRRDLESEKFILEARLHHFHQELSTEALLATRRFREVVEGYLRTRVDPELVTKAMNQFAGFRTPPLPGPFTESGRPVSIKSWRNGFRNSMEVDGLVGGFVSAMDGKFLKAFDDSIRSFFPFDHHKKNGAAADLESQVKELLFRVRGEIANRRAEGDDVLATGNKAIGRVVNDVMNDMGITVENLAEVGYLTPAEKRARHAEKFDSARKAIEEEIENLRGEQARLGMLRAEWEQHLFEESLKMGVPLSEEQQDERQEAMAYDIGIFSSERVPFEVKLTVPKLLPNATELEKTDHAEMVTDAKVLVRAVERFVTTKGESIYRAVRGETGDFRNLDADKLVSETVNRASLMSLSVKEEREKLKQLLEQGADIKGVSPGMVGLMLAEGRNGVVLSKGELLKFPKGKNALDSALEASFIMKKADGPVVLFPENARTLLKNHREVRGNEGQASLDAELKRVILHSAGVTEDMSLNDIYGTGALDQGHIEKNEPVALESAKRVKQGILDMGETLFQASAPDGSKQLGNHAVKMSETFSKLVYNIMLYDGDSRLSPEAQEKIDAMKAKLASDEWRESLTGLSRLDIIDTYSHAFTEVAGDLLASQLAAGVTSLGTGETSVLRLMSHNPARVRREFGDDFDSYVQAIRMLSLVEVGIDGQSGRFAFKAEYEEARQSLNETAKLLGSSWERGAKSYLYASLQGLEGAAKHNGTDNWTQARNWWRSISQGESELQNLKVLSKWKKGKVRTFMLEGNASLMEAAGVTTELIDKLRPIFTRMMERRPLTDGDSESVPTSEESFQWAMSEARSILLEGEKKKSQEGIKKHAKALNDLFSEVQRGYHLSGALTMGKAWDKGLKVQSVVPIRLATTQNPLADVKRDPGGDYIENSFKAVSFRRGSILGRGGYADRSSPQAREQSIMTLKPLDLNVMGAVDTMLRDTYYRMNVAPSYMIMNKAFGEEVVRQSGVPGLSDTGYIRPLIDGSDIVTREKMLQAFTAVVREGEMMIENDNRMGAEDSRLSRVYQGLGSWWIFRRLFSLWQPIIQTVPAVFGFHAKKGIVGKWGSLGTFWQAISLLTVAGLGKAAKKIPFFGALDTQMMRRGDALADFVRRTNIYIFHRGMDGQDRFKQTSRAMSIQGSLPSRIGKQTVSQYPAIMEKVMDWVFGGPERVMSKAIFVTELMEHIREEAYRTGEVDKIPASLDALFEMKGIDTLAKIRADIKTTDMMGISDQSKKSWWFQTQGKSPTAEQLRRSFVRMSNHIATTSSNMAALIPQIYAKARGRNVDPRMLKEAGENITGTLVQNTLFHFFKPKVGLPLALFIRHLLEGDDEDEAMRKATEDLEGLFKQRDLDEDASFMEQLPTRIGNTAKTWAFGRGKHKFEAGVGESQAVATREGFSDLFTRVGWEFAGLSGVAGHFAGYSTIGEVSEGTRMAAMDALLEWEHEQRKGYHVNLESKFDASIKKAGWLESAAGVTVPTQSIFDIGDIGYRAIGNAKEASALEVLDYLLHELFATREARPQKQKELEDVGGVDRWPR